MAQGPIGTHPKQAWKFAWPRNEPGQPPPGVDLRAGQIAVNRNYVDTLFASLGGSVPGVPPLLVAGVGLERNGVTVDLEPAELTEIGGVTEPPQDGKQYARFWDGAVWSWIEVQATPLDFGNGLTVDRTQTPNIVNLQPATDFSIGGLKEPPQTAPDQKDYVRRFNPALPEGWEWAETATADPYHFTTGLSFDDLTREVSLDPAGPTNMGGVIVPPRDATTQALAIDMGDLALGDPATGELRAPPATDQLLGALLEPPPDGISYVRQFDLTGQFWAWVEAATAGLQINAVIPDEVKFGPGELDVLVHCYGQHFTPTCVLYGSDGINPAQPLASSAYVNATEMTFLATPSQITQESLTTITVQDPAAIPPDPVLGAGAEPFRYVESLKVAGETIDRLGIVYVPPDMGLQIATDGALAAVVANDQKYGVILDAPFGSATWVRHGEGRWVPAPLPTYIAGNVPDDAGKVFVPARTAGQGLTLEDDGGLYLRTATPDHLGGFTEPRETGRQYARVRDETTGLGGWEEVSGMDEPPMSPVALWGRSNGGDRGWLPIPEQEPGMEEPPMSPVALWARSSGGARGWLEIPEPPPGIEEPPHDPVAVWGRTSAGDRGWAEVPTFDHLEGFVEKRGDTMRGFLTLHAQPEHPFHAATKDYVDLSEPQEAPHDGGQYVRQDGQWVEVDFPEGSMPEPPAEPVALWGRSSAGARGWLEAPTFEHLDGKVDKIGDTMTGDLTLAGPPTHPLHAANKDYVDLSEPQEAPFNGKTHGRKDGQWIEIPEAVVDSMDEPPMSPVAIWGRSSGGARGWIALDQTGVVVAGDNPGQKGIVYIPDRGGISLYQDGRIELSPTTPSQIGGIVDAPFSADPNDPTSYVRQDGAWVVSAAGDKVYIAGDTPDRTGIVYVPDGGGISLYQDGKIELSPATSTQKGAFIDAPWDGKSYARKDAAWVEAVGSEFTTVGRSPTQALEEGFDPVLKMRSLWVPLATDTLAGAIVEPPVDGKQYSRVNDAMVGAPAWVENTAKGVAVGDVPPTGPSPGDLWFESDSGSLFVFYDDGDSAQWVETGSGSETKATIEIGDAPPPNPTIGQFWWNSATGQTFIFYSDGTSDQWVQIAPGPEGGGTAGGITDAPLDGVQYGRQNGLWTEVVTSHTTISDTPPVNPQIADMWFQGTTLDTFIFYDDGSGPIWVQQNTPADFTGYATEAYVQNYVANAVIDAQTFVRSAAAKAPGHDTDLCQQALKAVEALSVTVKRLERRVKTLEGRR